MDTNRFVQVVVCFMFLSSVGQALRCLKGLQNPGDPLLDRVLQCPSSSAVCGRADFELVPGSGLSSSFDCVERGSCMPKNCAFFAGFDGVSLSKCEFKCCDNDLCNNQTLSNISHVDPLTTFPTPPIPEITTTSDSPSKITTVMVEPPTPDIAAETATGTNIPIPRPPGMVCLQGMKFPSGVMPTDTLACISETQVCARADFETPSFPGVTSFFNCVERSNCTQSKCETFLNLNGLTTSSCEFKCCSFDVCNNRSLSAPGWNLYPTTTTLAMDTTTLTETTTTSATAVTATATATATTALSATATTATTATPTTATLSTPEKTVPILSSRYKSETSVPLPHGLRCAHDTIPEMSNKTQNSMTCTSPTEVCMKADIKFALLSSATTLFKCVERIDCKMMNCSSIVGMNGIALSMCEFKCCDNDLCNNQTLSNISHMGLLTTFPTPPIPETTSTSDSPSKTTTVMVEPPTPDTGAETATGTNIPIPRPPGMVCLQGMKLPSGVMPTDTSACISETQVCARVVFEISNYPGITSFFKCVERSNCTQSKCEEHINMKGVTASACDFKCCSSDLCNNNTLSGITDINTDSISTTKAEMSEKTNSAVTSNAPEELQVTIKSILTTSGVCASTAFSLTVTVAAVFGAIVAANFDQ